MHTADTLTELSERLRRLEDMEEIRRLYVDYGRHLDDGDTVAYASLFARDGKLRMGPVGRADGREEITRAAAQMVGGRARSGEELGPPHRHPSNRTVRRRHRVGRVRMGGDSQGQRRRGAVSPGRSARG